jgi:hypothetical protein
VLYEFAPDLVVLASGTTGYAVHYVLGRDLLPHGFGPIRLAAGAHPPPSRGGAPDQ